MDLTAHAGLTLVAETMLALGLEAVVEEVLRLRVRQRGFAEYAKLQALVLLLAAGGECVEDVRVLAGDAGLARLLGGEGPSPAALHDFLAACHDEATLAQRPADGARIPAEPSALEALHAVNRHLVHRAVAARAPRQATLDLDATILESHKREARPHYRGGGAAPSRLRSCGPRRIWSSRTSPGMGTSPPARGPWRWPAGASRRCRPA